MRPRLALAVVAVGALAWLAPSSPFGPGRSAALAHITVVSPFTFHQDVRPILERRCGRCHAGGGVAPAALLRYEDARQQSWPIRQTLIAGRMPPWPAESGDVPFKGSPALTARELDVLMTWAAGGTPEGSAASAPAIAPVPAWALGKPDLIVSMPAPFTLGARMTAADHDVVLPAAGARGRWIRAVDLLPGTPAIVRRATIVIKTKAREQVAGLWVPGDAPQTFEGGGAFQLPPGASLILRVHYQKPRPDESTVVRDRSQVGLYFAAPSAAREVRVIDLTADPQPIDRDLRAVALRPVSGPVDATVRLVVVAENGSRTPLATLQLRPEWPRRYVFARAVPLARGSRIEAHVTPAQGALWRTLTGDRLVGAGDGGAFRAALETVD